MVTDYRRIPLEGNPCRNILDGVRLVSSGFSAQKAVDTAAGAAGKFIEIRLPFVTIVASPPSEPPDARHD